VGTHYWQPDFLLDIPFPEGVITMKRMVRVAMFLVLLMLPAVAVSAQTPVVTSGEPTAFASGVGQPATFFDERGNPVFEVVVTGVENDWQEYDELYAPERGMVYAKVDFTFTNLSDRAEIISPFSILLVDSTGLVLNQAYMPENPDIMVEDIPLDAGGTVEGSLVFSVFQDVEPMMVVWQPDFTQYVFIYLGEQP
jgi:hypothetical protein